MNTSDILDELIELRMELARAEGVENWEQDVTPNKPSDTVQDLIWAVEQDCVCTGPLLFGEH